MPTINTMQPKNPSNRISDERKKKVAVILIDRLTLRLQFYAESNKPVISDLIHEIDVTREFMLRQGNTITYTSEIFTCHREFYEKDQFVLLVGAGFKERIVAFMKSRGFIVVVRPHHPPTIEDVAADTPDKDYLNKLNLREEQKQIIAAIDKHNFGQFVAATGSGKTFLIRTLCRYYPKASFLITTYSLKLLNEIYKTLLEAGIRTSMFNGRKKESGARVYLCAMDSLDHFAKEKFDFLIIDERHEACTYKRIMRLLAIKARRAYGFSANEKDRSDKADKFSELVCGPVRFRAGYDKSVEANSVVPIKIEWRRYLAPPLIMDSTAPHFPHKAIWRNDDRNAAIAAAVEEHAKNGQVLIFVKTIEHIYYLKRALTVPCEVVHAKPSASRWDKLVKAELVSKTDKPPSLADLEAVKQRFKEGSTNVVICNTVWKRGIDIPKLGVVVMAHAGSSTEDIIQVAGRVSRLAEGKTQGLVVDFVDDFCPALHNRAKRRQEIYKNQKWEVISKTKP